MKTWRQGVIGRVELPGEQAFYLQCLTYPLARCFGVFDPVTGRLDQPLGMVRVRLGQFPLIERVGDSKLTAADRRLDSATAPWAEWGPHTPVDEGCG